MQIYHSALKSFPTLSTPNTPLNTPKAAEAASEVYMMLLRTDLKTRQAS